MFNKRNCKFLRDVLILILKIGNIFRVLLFHVFPSSESIFAVSRRKLSVMFAYETPKCEECVYGGRSLKEAVLFLITNMKTQADMDSIKTNL